MTTNKLPPIYLLLDEFPALERFPLVTDALARFRGYGVKIHVFVQTLAQIKEVYGEGWNTIVGNCGCRQFFGGTGDLFTAETISRWCGEGTGVQRSVNSNSTPGSQGGESYSTYKRSSYTPDEVMRFHLPNQLIMVSGKQPTIAILTHPSLSDFPEYLTFMAWIKAGHTVQEAMSATTKFANDRMPKPQPENNNKPKPGLLSRLLGRAG